MKNILFASCLGLFSSLMLSACGGGGSGTCGNTAACGGDIVGTWTITSSCVSASSMSAMTTMPGGTCTGVTLNSTSLTVAGGVTYNADLTYSLHSTASGSFVETIPASCLMFNGVTVTCAQLTQTIASDPTTMSMFKSFNCTGGSSCTCTITLADQASTETGTYTTTAAGLLTTTTSTGGGETDDYCVKGTTLTESPHASSTMMGTSLSGTITLAKQ